MTSSPTQRFDPSSPLDRLRVRPWRRLMTPRRPSQPAGYFWPLRNQRFFMLTFVRRFGKYWLLRQHGDARSRFERLHHCRFLAFSCGSIRVFCAGMSNRATLRVRLSLLASQRLRP